MKKKIVFIAQSNGGVAEYLYMFFNNFKNENYEIYLIVSDSYEEIKYKFEPLVEKIYIVPMVRNLNFKKDIKSIRDLRKILKDIKPDIAYLHSSKAGGIGRLALLFNNKIKIMYNAHGWYFNAKISELKKKIYIILEKILARRTDMIINISRAEYESAIKYKIATKEKMCIIDNGIDFSKFKEVNKYRNITRKELKISENEIVIGVVRKIK